MILLHTFAERCRRYSRNPKLPNTVIGHVMVPDGALEDFHAMQSPMGSFNG
jgi:hypothetical protein